jgi:hypothetical protein
VVITGTFVTVGGRCGDDLDLWQDLVLGHHVVLAYGRTPLEWFALGRHLEKQRDEIKLH